MSDAFTKDYTSGHRENITHTLRRPLHASMAFKYSYFLYPWLVSVLWRKTNKGMRDANGLFVAGGSKMCMSTRFELRGYNGKSFLALTTFDENFQNLQKDEFSKIIVYDGRWCWQLTHGSDEYHCRSTIKIPRWQTGVRLSLNWIQSHSFSR